MKVSRAIPKSLFQTDIKTIGSMLDILKQGGIVGVYPEGQIAPHGISIENGEAISKFIKKAGVPVVRALTGGGYFCNPPWAKTARKGPIESKVDVVLTAQQVAELDIHEITDILKQSIYMDNFKWQRSNGGRYTGKNLAQGLENLLYVCPGCKKEFSITTDHDDIVCVNCDVRARFCEDGHLTWRNESYFNHIGDWYLWQIRYEKMKITQNENYSVSEPVKLAMLRNTGAGVELVGEGVFTADMDRYSYLGTLNGKQVSLVFSASAIRYFPFDTGSNFQIYSHDLLYEFRPDNTKWCVKFANICENIYLMTRNEHGISRMVI